MTEPVDNDDDGCTAAHAYVLTGEHVCYACDCFVPVHTVLAVGPFSAIDAGTFVSADDSSALMYALAEAPFNLLAAIESVSESRMYLDHSRVRDDNYLMNYCRECGGKIGAHYVHEVGEAFFPMDDESIDKVQGHFVPGPHRIATSDISHSSWTDRWLARRPPVK